MNYTASSIKKEFDINKVLTMDGGLQCPQDQNWTSDDNTKCYENLHKPCPHKQTQTCKQRVDISDDGRKLTTLTFLFTISQTNLDGFIDEDDGQLKRLMRFLEKNEKYSINIGAFVKF